MHLNTVPIQPANVWIAGSFEIGADRIMKLEHITDLHRDTIRPLVLHQLYHETLIHACPAGNA